MAIILLAGCSKQTIEPSPPSLKGVWTYTSPTSHGSFTVEQVGDFVGITKGTFTLTVSGQESEYDIEQTSLIVDYLHPLKLIHVVNNPSGLWMDIKSINSDVNVIIVSKLYVDGSGLPVYSYTGDVTITKTK